MYHQKKLFALVLFAGLFLMGCNKDNDSGSESIEEIDLDKIDEYPYSELTPAEQKVKLENESLAFLEFGNALKTSSAIEAFQNLGRLLDEASVEIVEEKEVKTVKETVEYADAYGIFTWDSKKKEWVKTASKNELKFVFPAKKTSTSNNAAFSVQAVSSGIAVTDSYEEYDWDEEEDVEHEVTYYLPKSATGILTIDNKEAAKLEFAAEYKDNKQAPVSTEYKVTTNDGYVYWGKVDKATENQVAMKLTHNDQVMFEAMAKSGVKIDKIIDLEQNGDGAKGNYSLFDKANAYLKLMDNLVLVYTIDVENYVKEYEAIEDDYYAKGNALRRDWEAYDKNKNRYTLQGQYEKEKTDKLAAIFNKYMSITLASTKDGSKIADIVMKSEKEDGEYQGYWDYAYWDNNISEWTYDWQNDTYTKKYDYYLTNPYLKFKDNTLVEASVYFSEGFNKIEAKWEDFVKAFDR